jgi:hypothetical protein
MEATPPLIQVGAREGDTIEIPDWSATISLPIQTGAPRFLNRRRGRTIPPKNFVQSERLPIPPPPHKIYAFAELSPHPSPRSSSTTIVAG